ncbi:unnamed protein product [Meganyctiphanes norvegica]|uniref:Uncharacterized protein n=1 Tax=Meganyctiphanes norvegica TaxID=48144 RepID=A0AAV2PNX8_MEGNR
MLQLPGEYRAEIERGLASAKPGQFKYTFKDLNPLIEELIRIRKTSMANDNVESKPISAKIVEVEALVGTAKPLKNQKPTPSHSIPSGSQANTPDPKSSVDDQSQQQSHRFRGRGGFRGRGRGRGYLGHRYRYSNCLICDLDTHNTIFCNALESGKPIRDKLKMLGRCDACLMHKDEHGNTCAIIHRQCDHCLSDKHHKITCAKDHPGSWILKQK